MKPESRKDPTFPSPVLLPAVPAPLSQAGLQLAGSGLQGPSVTPWTLQNELAESQAWAADRGRWASGRTHRWSLPAAVESRGHTCCLPGSGPGGLLAPLTLNSCLFICCTQCFQVTFFTDKPLGFLLLNLQNSFYKIWALFPSRTWAAIRSVQFSHSVVSDSLRPLGLQHARLPFPSAAPQALLKLMSIELVVPSNHLILCRPLLLLPSIFPSIRVFSNESVHTRWPNHGVSASASVLQMNIQDWFHLGWTGWIFMQFKGLKSLLQHHSSKASIHETSARAWCTGKTQRDRVEREVGGGIGMGNTCKSMADSCQCMTKTTTIL